MNILKLLSENEETFFPWSDEEHPPLDAKKDFVKKEKEREEDLEGWVSL
mgnify:CR=1 FL=1